MNADDFSDFVNQAGWVHTSVFKPLGWEIETFHHNGSDIEREILYGQGEVVSTLDGMTITWTEEFFVKYDGIPTKNALSGAVLIDNVEFPEHDEPTLWWDMSTLLPLSFKAVDYSAITEDYLRDLVL